MTCNGCVRNVTSLISKISGVKSVDVNLVTSKAVIDADREISLDEIQKSFVDTKFKVSNSPPAFSVTFTKWFSKYFQLILAFSIVVVWALFRGYMAQWEIHSLMGSFMGGFFLVFGFLKVISWDKFAESYQGYDFISMKFPFYAYVYPAIEILLGFAYQLGFENQTLWNVLTVIILISSTIGVRRVLARKEQIKCVCIGGNSNVPITNFTVFENVLMIAMAVFMQFYH
jgi:copper chaperone CopZ